MLTHLFTPLEVPSIIAGKLPQIKYDLPRDGGQNSIYKSIQVLTDYTQRMALEHDFKMVQQCMALVEKLYDKGNALVKNAIENVFVFSFSTIMARCNAVEWRIVQSYMPSDLYTLYVRQVLKSKC
jgi:hypothetical protein